MAFVVSLLLQDQLNRKYNRGYLFVEYYNHACAEYARQKMTNPNFMMDGINPIVIWAVDSSAAAQVKRLEIKKKSHVFLIVSSPIVTLVIM